MSLSHWCKRVGETLDALLVETLPFIDDSGALNKDDLARVTANTTVQSKDITFPTDAKLRQAAIQQLGKLAKSNDESLRQANVRIAIRAAIMRCSTEQYLVR